MACHVNVGLGGSLHRDQQPLISLPNPGSDGAFGGSPLGLRLSYLMRRKVERLLVVKDRLPS